MGDKLLDVAEGIWPVVLVVDGFICSSDAHMCAVLPSMEFTKCVVDQGLRQAYQELLMSWTLVHLIEHVLVSYEFLECPPLLLLSTSTASEQAGLIFAERFMVLLL